MSPSAPAAASARPAKASSASALVENDQRLRQAVRQVARVTYGPEQGAH